ncbi:MAG: hypothetical protein ACTSRZ_16875 [Promethearchaeota archaeon]
MSKSKKYLFAFFMGLLFLVSVGTTAYAAATDYLPTENDLEGYNLLWSAEYSTENPWDETSNMTCGAQVWYKNDTEGVVAVIGAVVLEASNHPLLQAPSDEVKTILENAFLGIDTTNWWTIFVYFLTQSPYVNDITDSIETTDSSIEISAPYLYMIVSLDANYIIWTIAFQITSLWWEWVVNNTQMIQNQFDSFMVQFPSYFGGFLNYFGQNPGPSASSIPDPEASAPALTSSEDVQDFTSELGTYYKAGIPGYEPLLILAIAGVFIFLISRKIKK